MITAITPTGDRVLAFALCQYWMSRQTVKPDQWIVVDDGKVPMTPFVPMEYIRREPLPSDPEHTLTVNLKAAYPLIKGNKIMIIEDDEYYAPGYVAEMATRLDHHELVGIKHAKYYHLGSGGYCTHANINHASFAETAFRASFLPIFKPFLDIDIHTFLDIRIWRKVRGIVHLRAPSQMKRDRRGFLFVDDPPLYLGVKGLPGRVGIGIGHDEKRYAHRDTPDRDVLKKWIPGDYQVYLDILNSKLTEENCDPYFSV